MINLEEWSNPLVEIIVEACNAMNLRYSGFFKLTLR